MFRKLALLFLLVTALAPCVCSAEEDGNSWDTAYIIDSYSEFRTYMQGDEVTSGKYFKLSCDIQLAGISDWEPKGTLSSPFSGHFDGQGHIIYINIQPLPVTVGEYIKLTYDRSLFGVLGSGGEIKSLDVEGVVRGYNAGGLVSVMQGGTITNCSFSGDIIVETSPEGSDAMGELIYELGDDDIQDANGVEILDDVETKTRVYGKINAGGLVAVMLGGNIANSSFRGNVTATADETPASAGGIVGRMIEDSGSISGCCVEGDAVITASTSANGYGVLAMAGGIAGYANTQLESSIESCTFDGYVNSTYYAGGIAGAVRGTILSENTVTSKSRITGTYSAGGIAGYMASGAWATGNIIESDVVITAEVYSSGGIIGLLETSGRTGSNMAVENNSSDATISGDVYQGGIIGALGNSTYSGAVLGEGNTCSSEYYVIGRDEWGQPSNGGTYSISTTSFTWTAGESKTITLTVNGLSDSTAATWSFSGLPDGLTANSSGNITGTLTTAGTYAFTATANISGYGDISQSITITVTSEDTSGFYIATSSLVSGTQDTYYSAAISAAGYTDYDSISWSLVSGTLPSGLTFGNAAGVSGYYSTTDVRGLLYGTPTVSGYFTFTVQAVLTLGSASYSATKAFTLYVAPTRVVISTDELPDASLRRSYTADIEADIFSGWTLSDGALPDGLSLSTVNGKGRISGTPSESGSFTFTVTAAASELTGTKTFTLVVNDADFTITTGSLLKPGIAGEAYTETLSHDAGTSASSPVWYVYSGTLPAELSLSRTDGIISGTPTTAGTYTFRIGLMIGDQITSKSFTIIIIPAGTASAISITTDYIKPGVKDNEYSMILLTDASGSQCIWYLDSGSLPEGLTLDSSTGTISGSPATAGNYTFTIGLYADEQITTKSFTMTIVPNTSTYGYSITTSSLTPGTRGQTYTQKLDTNAPASSPVWYIDSGSLPAGLSLSRSTGTISGTPSESGTYTFTVGVWAGNIILTKTFALVIVPGISITTDYIKPGIRGQEYSLTLSNDSGVAASSCVWYVDSGNLPDGLSLSSAGIISGTPTAAGSYTFTIGLLADGYTATRSYTMIVIPGSMPSDLTITTDALKPAIRGTSYTYLLSADVSSSLGTPIWYIDSGTLPTGLSLSSTGTISGTPTVSGSYSVTIGVTAGNYIATKTFTLVVIPAVMASDFSITTDALTPATRGTPYTQTLYTDASSGTPVWYIDSGSLPSGLSLSRGGVISGTPTTSGSYTFTVGLFIGTQVTTKSFTLVVIYASMPSDLTITTDALKPAVRGQEYSFDITTDASSGTPVWYIDSGSLPSGLSLSSSGRISGTPTVSGSYSVTIGVAVGNYIATKSFTLVVIPAVMDSDFSITTDAIKPAARGTAYSFDITTDASTSLGSRTWYIDSGSLPSGLSLSGTGRISGTPTTAGTYTFTVGLFIGSQIVTKSFSMVVIPAVIASDFSITTDAIKPATRGTAYSFDITTDASTSLGSRTWYIDSGSLPSGLSLSGTGRISGTPTTAGTYTFTVGLFIGSQIVTKSFSMVVIPAVIASDFSITTDALTPSTRGSSYSFTLTTDASSSLGTPVWYVDSGSLPDGLSLSSSGTISGTPTTAGTYTFTVGLFVGRYIVTKSFSLVVIPAATSSDFTITTDALKPGIRGTAYSFTLTTDASSSLGTPVWYLDSGSLPDGLSLSSSGTISGIPTTAGSYTFTVGMFIDTLIVTKSFTMLIISAAMPSDFSITTDALTYATRGSSYSFTLTTDASSSLGTPVWYLDSGSLPDGLSLSATGTISGTPTTAGSYTFTVGLVAGNQIVTKSFTMLVIYAAISSDFSITAESLRTGVRGNTYSQTLTDNASASLTPRVWYLAEGELPTGLSLSRTTGTISGTPRASGTYTFAVGLIAGGITATKTFTLLILPGLSITTDWLKPAIQGTPYSAVLSADGVVSKDSCVWYIESGTLPNGLTLSRDTGILSGTPTSYGSYTFTIGLLADGMTASRSFTLTVISGIVSSDYSITTDSLPPGIAGSSYAQTLASDIPSSYTPRYWYINSGTLPEGLSLSLTAGIISGTPASSGTYTFTVGLLAGNQLLFKEFTLTVIPGTSITTEALPPGTEGKAYSQTLASDSSASGTRIWYIDTGELPPGLTLARNTGVISGTPTKSGTYTFRVRLLIGDRITAKTFTLLIIPGLALSGDTLPEGKEGEAYSYTFTASADSAVWTHTAGTLPPGLSLSTGGILSGTPTKSGTYSFTVRAEASSEGLRAERTFSLTIRPVFSILTDEALPRAKTGVWYSETLSSDAEAVNLVSWRILDGSLPEGLYLNSSTGNISGTPQAEGTYTFTIQASAGNYIAAKRFTLIVGPALEILTEAQLPSWKLDKYYSMLFTTDSVLPVNWSLTDGSIPSGLYFADGVLDGTPTAEGTYSFTLTAESGGLTASKTFTMTIKPALSITTPAILPSVKAKAYYSYTLSSDADDPGTVLWSTTYSSVYDYNGLPAGMYVDETTGTIYGTPTVEGTYTFTIRAVMGSISTSKEFTLTVRPMLSIETENPLPHAEVNEKYSVTLLTDADENHTVVWTVIEGTLPDRLILDSQTGELSGYPLNEGTYYFTIQAFSSGLTAQKRFELTAGEVMSIIVPEAEPLLEAGEYFEMALLTDKTNAVNTKWTVIDGILPPGIDLNTSTGVISGTPSRAGRYTITVKAESGYSVAVKTITLTVDFMISSEWLLPNGAVGESYSYRFTAKGVSTSAVLWTVSSDSVLPKGLTLATNGILSGITNESGTYTFMLYAFVSNDVSAMQTVRLTVDADPNSAVPILTTSLPDGQVSQDYYAELRAGIEGVTWQLESGELPDGLTLGAEGLISGVPARAGTYVFIVRVSASNRYSTRQFTITINSEPDTRYASGGGGGGCDSGFGMIGLAVFGLMFRRRIR